MKSIRHYNSLFVEPTGRGTLHLFRTKFSADQLGADTRGIFFEFAGQGGWRPLNYSFRTPTHVSVEMLEALSERWPSHRFVLFHETFGPIGVASIGFSMVEGGLRRNYWGSTISVDGLPTWAPPSNSFGQYERYRCPWEVFEKRLRSVGIEPDDPISNAPGYDDHDDEW